MLNSDKNTLKKLKDFGWILINNYATENDCDQIKESLTIKSEGLINSKLTTPVFLGKTIFNTTILAESEKAFQLVTNKFIRKTSYDFLENQPLLKCVRSYRIIRGEKRFRWHADNKSPIDSKVDKSKGLVFIIYLEDDDFGSFALAENSHNTSNSATASLKDVENWKKNNLIKNIIAKKGDLLIFSQDIFHKHILEERMKSFDAIWFQIVSEKYATTEKLFIDPSFLYEDFNLLKFLGINHQQKINYANPRTSYGELPLIETIKLIIKLTFSLLLKIPRNIKMEIIILLRYILGPLKKNK